MVGIEAFFDNNPGIRSKTLVVDNREYLLHVSRKVYCLPEAPRLAVVSYLPNKDSIEILKACILTIKKFTPESHELWIIDNNSPEENIGWLNNLEQVNLILNRTEPLPAQSANADLHQGNQLQNGSYANALALEVFTRLIDQDSQIIFPLHMDTMPCRSNWLSYLSSKLNQSVKAAGVRMDRSRSPMGVLHVLGYAVDFQVFKQLNLTFFPCLPKFDVGDLVTIELRKAGFQVFACRNSLWEPQLIDQLPAASPFRALSVDRSFDDEDHVIFLHLGRGIRKSSGEHKKGTSIEQWLRFANQYLL